MQYNKTVVIPSETADLINHYLFDDITCESDSQSEDDTIIYTAEFENGLEMDIKCCGVQFHEDTEYYGPNNSWCEAVLFRNGSEVAGTEVEEDFFGEWELEYDGDLYVVEVIEG